jgi:hypothetical protein
MKMRPSMVLLSCILGAGVVVLSGCYNRTTHATNKACGAPPAAEQQEGRGLAKGNPAQQNRDRAQDRAALQSALDRIRQLSGKEEGIRFTTLWHHVYEIRRLREAFLSMRKDAAAGVDGGVRGVRHGQLILS